MDKKRIEIIITSALILLFIFASINAIKALKKKAVGVSGPVSRQIRKEILAKQQEQKEIFENLVWVRCPFSGKVYSSAEGIELNLMGIIWDKQAPLAIINDSIVKPGDRMGANRVIAIEPDRVILNDGTKDFELKLGR